MLLLHDDWSLELMRHRWLSKTREIMVLLKSSPYKVLWKAFSISSLLCNTFTFIRWLTWWCHFTSKALYKVEGDGTLTSLSQAYSFLWRKLHALLVDPIWHMSFALEAYVHVGCWVTANFIISLSENPSLERKPHLRFFPCSST